MQFNKMNFLLFVVVFGGTVVSSVPFVLDPRRPSDSIRQNLENIKKQMPCGFPKLDLSPLAPYKRSQGEARFDVDEEFGQASGQLTNLRIDGLDDFDIDDITFSVLTFKIRYNLNFKKIRALSQYTLDVARPVIVNSKGNLVLRLSDFRIKGTLKLGATFRGVQVKEFTSDVTLGGAVSNFSGIGDYEKFNDFINEVIEKMGADVVSKQQVFINQRIYDFIVPAANRILSQYSLLDIIATIGTPFQPSTCIPPPDYIHYTLH